MWRKIILLSFLSCLVISNGLKAQNATISFRVNMSYQIFLGNFDPSTEFVDLAGDFNGWGSALTILTDDDGDNIFSITLSGFYVSQTIEFKFRQNGAWDGTEEFPGGGPNREFTVLTIQDSVYVWYNDETPPFGPPDANFTVSSTEIKTQGNVQFSNLSSGNIEYWQWFFEGGYPEISSQQNPQVSYAGAGSFDVRLIVGNSSEVDTLLITDYIAVIERDKTELDWWNNTVFYEAFVRSFYDSDGDGIGDFIGFTEKLDYLNDGNPDTEEDLGIGGIWLMPINPSPSYHGYDVTNYFGINPDYGTMAEFQAFLDSAHAKGIKVIIDLVMNHSSSQHQWFIDSKNYQNNKRDFYRWSATDPGYSGPWGQQVWHWHSSGYYYGVFWGGMPDINYGEPQVVDSMFYVAEYWLNEIGVDGFRLDAAGLIFEDGENLEHVPATIQFWKDFTAHNKSIAPESFSVGEVWSNTNTIVNYVEDDGLDFCFEFDLAGTILDAVNNGYTSNLYAKMSHIYNVYPHLQWGIFLTNHDMNRVMNSIGQDQNKNKLAAAIYLTLPGIPFIYYGEEIGMLGEKPDENIRRPMQWTDGYQAGFTTGNPWNSINGNYISFNVETERTDSNSIFNRYKKMIRARNLKPALQEGDYIEAISDNNSIYSFVRATNTDTAIVLINTANGNVNNISINLGISGLQPGTYNWFEMMSEEFRVVTIDNDQSLFIPEMEAYEVIILSPNLTTESPTREIELTAWLEGPFNGTGMNTNLTGQPGPVEGFPLTQPYNIAPWNYNGSENVLSIPNADVVDWILIELRETAGGASSASSDSIIARKAGFILNNGSIVGLDGTIPIQVEAEIHNELYVVLWHRNHIGIMSAIPLVEVNGVYSYDFTTSSGQAFGIDAQKELSPGAWGLIAADGNADGFINNLDISTIWAPQAGDAGYNSADFDLNAEADNKDKDDVWVPNEGKGSQVPE